MEAALLSCSGAEIGQLSAPPFELHRGEVVSLFLPAVTSPADESALIDALTANQPCPDLILRGRVRQALPAAYPANFFALLRWGRLTQPRPVDWLQRNAPLSPKEANEICVRHGLQPEWRLCQLAGNQKALLGLEAAIAHRPDVLVFDTVGLDFNGVRGMFAAIDSFRRSGAAVYLSTCYSCQDRTERLWFPGSARVELIHRRRQLAGAASATVREL